IDLFLDRVTRVHHDVDIVLSFEDQFLLQDYMAARGWKWVSPNEGKLEPWPPGLRLELPRFQAHAHRDGAFMDFLLTDMRENTWRFRRKPEITLPVRQIGLCSRTGIPFLVPEIAILFKSRRDNGEPGRRKDREDFEKILSHLERER